MTGRNANADSSVCAQARERMHAVLDDGLVDATLRRRLDDHLADCAACRARFDALRDLQRSLRALPAPPAPEDLLEEVFARTRSIKPASRAWLDWRVAAAAAVLVLMSWGAWSLRSDLAKSVDVAPVATADPQDDPGDSPDGSGELSETEYAPEYSEQEKEQAIREARMALKLAADAIDRARQASARRLEQVLSEDVSPALERVPVKLPAARPQAKDSHT